jgi:hypothetical protein
MLDGLFLQIALGVIKDDQNQFIDRVADLLLSGLVQVESD